MRAFGFGRQTVGLGRTDQVLIVIHSITDQTIQLRMCFGSNTRGIVTDISPDNGRFLRQTPPPD